MSETETAVPLTVRRLSTSGPLKSGSYQWVIVRGDVIVGYFATRKAAEEFIALSATYRR